ncbi:MAG TPA: hypothetical protein VGN00_24175 [Puia sp.]
MEALKYTCQLLTFKSIKSNIPKGKASCVLFEFNNRFFAFSNAHVLADGLAPKAQFLIENGKSGSIGGTFMTSSLPESNKREDDLMDLAVVLLNDNSVELLKQSGRKFLQIGDIKTGYIQKESDIFLIAGYPASRTKTPVKRGGVEIRSLPFLLFTRPSQNSEDRYKGDWHYFAAYSRRTLRKSNTTGIVVGPNPAGLSGSGFWLISMDEGGLLRSKLVGILSVYSRTRSIFVATKIDFFVDIIRQHFDHTIPNFGREAILRFRRSK